MPVRTNSLAVAVAVWPSQMIKKSFMRTVIGEVLTGLVTGAVTGLTIFAIVAVWKQNPILGFVIGMAMILCHYGSESPQSLIQC